MNARLWLQMLQRWLEQPETSEDHVDRRQVQQDRAQLEMRKAQATAWYFSPPY
jgi:hypothetical protein